MVKTIDFGNLSIFERENHLDYRIETFDNFFTLKRVDSYQILDICLFWKVMNMSSVDPN